MARLGARLHRRGTGFLCAKSPEPLRDEALRGRRLPGETKITPGSEVSPKAAIFFDRGVVLQYGGFSVEGTFEAYQKRWGCSDEGLA